MVFSRILHKLEPRKYPGFAYSWLEMVSNEIFIEFLDKAQNEDREKFYRAYSMLVEDLFKFYQTEMKGNL